MKPKLEPIPISMPRTLVDLIDETAPKARSKHIISLINSFYQHPVEKTDLSDLGDPEDDTVSFTLRLPKEQVDQLKFLCLLRHRDRNQMVKVAVYSQLTQHYR